MGAHTLLIVSFTFTHKSVFLKGKSRVIDQRALHIGTPAADINCTL